MLAVAVLAFGLSACASGNGSTSGGLFANAAAASSTPPGAGDKTLCSDLAAYVYSLHDSYGAGSGVREQSATDQWDVSWPALNGKFDPLDADPWLMLTNPGAPAIRCAAPDGMAKSLLFPDQPGVQANVTKQFSTALSRVKASVWRGSGQGFTRVVVDPGHGHADVDLLTTFTHKGKHYVVIYHDANLSWYDDFPNDDPTTSSDDTSGGN
ncbi:MAG: hypothetical protein J2P17_14315 [Mycobacterium sp.]|nr:hypothetical protein [Mycobacterium sp.]